MLSHVKVLACILWLEVMGFTLIRYLIIEYLVQVCNKENHDMIMVSFCKACDDPPLKKNRLAENV